MPRDEGKTEGMRAKQGLGGGIAAAQTVDEDALVEHIDLATHEAVGPGGGHAEGLGAEDERTGGIEPAQQDDAVGPGLARGCQPRLAGDGLRGGFGLRAGGVRGDKRGAALLQRR